MLFLMLQTLNHRRRAFAMICATVIVLQILIPYSAYALTSGPSQPEFAGFTAVGTSDMVNLFTGDLNYSIPLFELPGPGGSYPFTLSYQSGITMDQEASWVGLGWNLNAGAINRQMRGLPDEFNGDIVTTVNDMKPNVTWDFGIGADIELIATPKNTSMDSSFGSVNLGLRFSHNSYKGWDAGLDLGLNIQPFGSSGFGFNAGVSTSAIEGANLNLGVSLAQQSGDIINSYSLGTNINSREGLMSISLSTSSGFMKSTLDSPTEGYVGLSSSSAGISFARQSYIPGNSIRYTGGAFDGTLEIGVETFLPHIGGRVNVSKSKQEIHNSGDEVGVKGYGFLYSRQRETHQNFVMDLNRSAGGPLHRFTQNLEIPNTTPDLYSVSSAGINTMFQAARSDIGIYTDPSIKSTYTDANIGVDLNFGTYADIGVNLGARVSSSFNDIWPVDHLALDSFQFTTSRLNTDYNPAYFKVPGELAGESVSSFNYMLEDEALRPGLNRDELAIPAVMERNHSHTHSIETGQRASREPLATSIQYVTNAELTTGPGNTIPEYTSWIWNGGNREELNRSDDSLHHIAGFEVLETNGLRYVYGLPVMNIEHAEHLFSVARPNSCTNEVQASNPPQYHVPGTESFYQQRQLPQYAHSYLLTAVLGQDYLDIDEIPGPSDGDLGYWVRFEYEQYEDFAWRAPYDNASYLPGVVLSIRDDKGSYLYGKRRQYYLKYAETRTHQAEFITEDRQDNQGAEDEEQHKAVSQRLKNILLRTKSDQNTSDYRAIKRVAFCYAAENCGQLGVPAQESLCQSAPNGPTGKLTLTSLSFSYQNSTEGESTPYQFEYNTDFDYNTRNQDRWGRYQPVEDDCWAAEYPFTRQDSMNAIIWAAAWQLSKITLPSGAIIDIQYEADDYAYVQDMYAMQMYRITGAGAVNESTLTDSEESRRIYFQVPDGILVEEKRDLVPFMRGIHGLQIDDDGNVLNSEKSQVYFKARMTISENSGEDYISGYARIEAFDVDEQGSYVQLAPFKLAGKNYHPFSAAAWQKMKLEYPHAASTADFEDTDQSFREVIGLLAASISEIGQLFRKFYTTCDIRNYARTIEPELSIIRLTNATGYKIGGDSRVKQVQLTDNWEAVSTFGQVYDYSIIDEQGRRISSGVAENEPSVGYEECPLRYAKLYQGELPIHSSQNLMFEYPINEAYLPGASVGYRQVTVSSLANKQLGMPGLPEHFSTTGRTVHEFYTAKDFPILFEETTIDAHVPPGPSFVRSIAPYQRTSFSASQGYAIVLNDMHGKQFRVRHYGQDNFNNDLETIINEQKYTYFEGDVAVSQQLGKYLTQRTLNNSLPALIAYEEDPDAPGKLHIRDQEFGVDREFFLDMRSSHTTASSVRVGLNVVFTPTVSIFFVPIPLPGGNVNIQFSEGRTRTAVANKIIRRSGVIKQIDIYDGQSHLRTNNLVFDKITGRPVLTSVNNAFDDEIYSLTIPAHYAYPGMGAAYENYRVPFSGSISGTHNCASWQTLTLDEEDVSQYVKIDDELLIMEQGQVVGTAVVVAEEGSSYFLQSTTTFIDGTYDFVILRSGARNMLSASTMSLSSLGNPTENLTTDENEASVPDQDGVEENLDLSGLTAHNVLGIEATTFHKIPALRPDDCTVPPVDTLRCYCISVVISCECDGVVTIVKITNGDTTSILEQVVDACDPIEDLEIGVGCSVEPLGTEFDAYFEPDNPECETVPDLTVTEEDVIYCVQRPTIFMNPLTPDAINQLSDATWQPRSSYKFIAPREGISLVSNDEIDLSTAGILSNVVLFDPINPFFEFGELSANWIRTDRMMQVVPQGNEVVSFNAIGIPNTLINGFPVHNGVREVGNLPIISAQNALPFEVAFESFEDQSWMGNSPPLSNRACSNLTLAEESDPCRIEKYEILGAISGVPEACVIAKQFDSQDMPDSIYLDLINEHGERLFQGVCEITGQSAVDISVYGASIYPFDQATRYTFDWPMGCPSLSGLKRGDVFLIYHFIGDQQRTGTRTSNAHTGKASFLPHTGVPRMQTALNLQGGKEYIVEAWIHVQNMADSASYPDLGVPYLSVSGVSSGGIAQPVGPIIEEWQQIRGVFVAAGGPISLTFVHPMIRAVYYDDIRISPLESSVTTYVYDPEKMRLIAELDDNNFATLYSYDQEGNLVLIRKETERGIKTIQESRSHVHHFE